MTRKSDSDLLKAVEGVFIEAMNSKEATLKEKIDAAKEATKLLMVRHKITDSSNESGSFFNGR